MTPPTLNTSNEFFLHGGRTGVLLIHGLTGTPAEMRLLAKGLHRAGHTVYGVQLAGHCGTHEDLIRTRWQDWYASVRAGADKLLAHVDSMYVVGLSMGALLALKLAADRPEDVAGVGALSPTFHYDGWSIPVYTRLAFLLPLFRALGIGRQRSFYEQPPYGIKDVLIRNKISAQMHAGNSAAAGLPGNPWYSVIELRALSRHVRKLLPTIHAPCLVVHAIDDDIASLRNNAQLICDKVQGHVDSLWLNNSYHLITIDRERRKVIAAVKGFIQHAQARHLVLAQAKPTPTPAPDSLARHKTDGLPTVHRSIDRAMA
ncbi:MAG: alpha/beta fold hydrolase [Burkholderiaceae bacterium]|nr:alpha/beta fold hydrolase [Burkholderiaceae bacterium]